MHSTSFEPEDNCRMRFMHSGAKVLCALHSKYPYTKPCFDCRGSATCSDLKGFDFTMRLLCSEIPLKGCSLNK